MSEDDHDSAGNETRKDLAASLGPIVEQEARRVLSERLTEGDPERLAEGWERRFIADPGRAREAIELYTQLGYEVLADPVRPEDLGEGCEDCVLVAALRFQVIYTRKRGSEG